MGRPKKNNEVRSFVFTVNTEDPRYTDLINFLDGIDSGARAYVIRQILNSYVCEQGVGKVGNSFIAPTNMEMDNQAENSPRKAENAPTSAQRVERTTGIQTRKSSFKSKMTGANIDKTKEEKVIPSEGMSKLLTNFQ